MKISPISSVPVATSEPQSRVESVRHIKMNTNATPGKVLEPFEEEVKEPETVEKLPNLDTNETQEVNEETKPLSPQFAALARERRSLQRERKELEELKKGLEAKSQGSDVIERSRLKSEPLNVLLEAGVTYEQLTEAILANQQNPEVNTLKSKMTELESKVDQRFEERAKQERAQVVKQMQREASLLVSTGDEFELVRETRSVPDVIRLIEKTYDEHGELLDVQEACRFIEEELFKKSQKLAGLKKLKDHFGSKSPEPQMKQQPGMRTLTNKDTASIVLDRKACAIAAFNGTLKR
jgi:hypothetical protein